MGSGTVFAIVFFSLVGGYFVLGMLWGRYKHRAFAHPHAKGIRRFFYRVGDGFGFALNGCALLRKPLAAHAQSDSRAVFDLRPTSPEEQAKKKLSVSRPAGRLEGADSAMILVDDQAMDQPGYQSI